MRVFTLYLLALICFVAASSCESEKQPATFYAIDSLVSGQVRYLTEVNARLVKEASLAGQGDTVTFSPTDTAGWQKELDVFRKLDEINKPVNRGRYEISDGTLDRGSNLTIKSFTSKESLPVSYLRIYYQGNVSKPRKIEALYDEHNPLYSSARLLSMHFEQIDNRTVLTSYSVKGGQRMVFGDSVAFYISAKILID